MESFDDIENKRGVNNNTISDVIDVVCVFRNVSLNVVFYHWDIEEDMKKRDD
jgi:hypothetical protein